MATTTNYSWTTPDDTGLVKDGASAIRTLGSAVDTSMANLRGGTTGQILRKTSATQMDFAWSAAPATVLLNTTSFSAVSSQTINNVFSSTYDNYQIIVKGTDSGTAGVQFKLSAGGSDVSTGYSRSQYGYTYAGAIENDSSASATYVAVGRANGATFSSNITVVSPFLSETTRIMSVGQDSSRGATWWGFLNNTTSYTNFSLIFATSATGTIRVYGYNN
jgi:hypothetical protein